MYKHRSVYVKGYHGDVCEIPQHEPEKYVKNEVVFERGERSTEPTEETTFMFSVKS